jgi:hypothetical protein
MVEAMSRLVMARGVEVGWLPAASVARICGSIADGPSGAAPSKKSECETAPACHSWTFDIDENRYTGLLRNKRAIAVYPSGTFGPTRGPAFGNDFQSTYFRDWLNLIGVTDVAEIRLQPTIYSPTFDDDDDRRAVLLARELGAGFDVSAG